ncbi:hypothetical protein R1sor_027461 [Riccia sorocarpa]|uniref:Uncharacterized protein n=1 Tax=Riccia sorocarpa TaxID=122646 RepID=A0ABD3GF07_9MARC
MLEPVCLRASAHASSGLNERGRGFGIWRMDGADLHPSNAKLVLAPSSTSVRRLADARSAEGVSGNVERSRREEHIPYLVNENRRVGNFFMCWFMEEIERSEEMNAVNVMSSGGEG